MGMKNNINYLDIYHHAEGNERREEIQLDTLDRAAYVPKTVTYKDIDTSVKEFVENDLDFVGLSGVRYPTIRLFSNQRFSEYMQTWSHTDNNNNILLNFKTITRETNPEYGDIENKNWNIPYNEFKTVISENVLDDNGNESKLVVKMKQPTAINLKYKISIFTTYYEDINNFNTKINRKFNCRQAYIAPNGYYMPLILESINDESEYNIDDRQFYSQTYTLDLKGYLITNEDIRVEEVPIKHTLKINAIESKQRRNRASVEIEELSNLNKNYIIKYKRKKYYYKPCNITIDFARNQTKGEFTIDCNFTITQIKRENIQKYFTITVNDNPIDISGDVILNYNDRIEINAKTQDPKNGGKMIICGYDRDSIMDEKMNDVDIDLEKVEIKK